MSAACVRTAALPFTFQDVPRNYLYQGQRSESQWKIRHLYLGYSCEIFFLFHVSLIPTILPLPPYNQTSWPFVTKQLQASWLVVPQMCLDVFLHSLTCSDVFFLGPMCPDVFFLGPMCPNWWRRLLTAHTASQSQSSHKPHSRRDSKPIFTQNPKSKSHFFWNQKCVPPIFSSFHQNATKIALLIKSNKEFG